MPGANPGGGEGSWGSFHLHPVFSGGGRGSGMDLQKSNRRKNVNTLNRNAVHFSTSTVTQTPLS